MGYQLAEHQIFRALKKVGPEAILTDYFAKMFLQPLQVVPILGYTIKCPMICL